MLAVFPSPQFDRRRHRVALLGRLGRAVGDLAGEANIAARGQADDPAPGPAAGYVPPSELGDQQARGHRVHAELLLPDGGIMA